MSGLPKIGHLWAIYEYSPSSQMIALRGLSLRTPAPCLLGLGRGCHFHRPAELPTVGMFSLSASTPSQSAHSRTTAIWCILRLKYVECVGRIGGRNLGRQNRRVNDVRVVCVQLQGIEKMIEHLLNFSFSSFDALRSAQIFEHDGASRFVLSRTAFQ